MPATNLSLGRTRSLSCRPVACLLLLLTATALGVILFQVVRPAHAGAEKRSRERADAPPTSSTAAAADAYGRLPLQFEANRGQTDERVRFVSRGSGYVLFLTADEAVMALRSRSPRPVGKTDKASPDGAQDGYRVLRMKLVGASQNPRVEGIDETTGKLNYFVGSDPAAWRTNVPVFGRVRYSEVYPGVGLEYYGNQQQLEYDFRVAPGADPRAIRIKFEGAERAAVDKADGSLSLFVGDGEVRMKRPVIYQVGDDGSRQEVEGGYKVNGREVEFSVGPYDQGRPLVIDPVLSYSTFLGLAGNFNSVNGPSLALDSSGDAYIAGSAGSLSFPAPGVKLIPACSGSSNVFVTRLDPTGTSLIYTSYIGGFSEDVGLGIALDSSGAAYVTGRTSSSDFPTTTNALRTDDDLFKSADGGATWHLSNNGLQNRPVSRIWANPSSASTVYALSNGLYKTTDGGASWSRLNTGLDSSNNTGTQSFAITPSNPSILYAGSAGVTSLIGSITLPLRQAYASSYKPTNNVTLPISLPQLEASLCRGNYKLPDFLWLSNLRSWAIGSNSLPKVQISDWTFQLRLIWL